MTSPDDPDDSRQPVTLRPVQRYGPQGEAESDIDAVAVEAPLEIRIAGETVAITMRTPGADRELALGFLFAEGVVESVADVGGVAHCGRPDEEGYGHTIDVQPGPGVALDPETHPALRRGTLISSACGVCGRRSIDDLLARLPKRGEPTPLSPALLAGATARLAENQPSFRRTGGMHAAAVLTSEGEFLFGHEDVGRHNAVDKVVGTMLLRSALPATMPRPDDPAILAVSGRVSFEIVQKAAVAGLTAVAGISAPTSLAVDLAREAGLTLAAFARDGRVSVY
jgi:FdhD protein